MATYVNGCEDFALSINVAIELNLHFLQFFYKHKLLYIQPKVEREKERKRREKERKRRKQENYPRGQRDP